MPRAQAALATCADVGNVPLDDETAERLIETAQRERTRPDPCPICGVDQDRHWKCANCTCRGHYIPRSRMHPDYCAWCVQEGSAQRHQARQLQDQAA